MWKDVIDNLAWNGAAKQAVDENHAYVAFMTCQYASWSGFETFSDLERLADILKEVQTDADAENYCDVTVYDRNGKELNYKLTVVVKAEWVL